MLSCCKRVRVGCRRRLFPRRPRNASHRKAESGYPASQNRKLTCPQGKSNIYSETDPCLNSYIVYGVGSFAGQWASDYVIGKSNLGPAIDWTGKIIFAGSFDEDFG